MFGIRNRGFRRGLRWRLAAAGALVAAAGLAGGCRHQKLVVLDNQPGWMEQAEQQLTGDADWKVGGTGAARSSSGFFGGHAPTRSEPVAAQRVPVARSRVARSQPAAAPQPSPPSSPSRSSASAPAAPEMPPGVQWSDTRITVTVED